MLPAVARSRPTLLRRVGLGLLLLVAFVLRVWNLNWDQGQHQHPDERYWSIVSNDISWEGPAGYFDSAGSQLNPYTDRDTWVYGTFPLFTTKAVAGFLDRGPFPAGALVGMADSLGIELRTDGFDDQGNPARINAFDDGYNVNLVGRLLSALIDTATVLLVYVLGCELFDRRVGFVGATLATCSVLQIQYAHFYGAEPWVTFFVTLGLLMSVRLLRRMAPPGGIAVPAPRPVALVAAATGLTFGLAAASKLTAALTLVVPALAVLIAIAAPMRDVARSIDSWVSRWSAVALLVALALGSALGLSAPALALLVIAAVPTGPFVAAVAVPLMESFRGATGARAPTDSTAVDVLHTGHRLRRPALRIALGAGAGTGVLAVAALTFRVFQPYAFDGVFSLDSRFTSDLDYLSGVNSGGNVPWVVQWIDRTPLWFPLHSALRWGLGPALGLAVAVGIIAVGREVVLRHRWELLLPLVLIATMVGLVSQQFNPLIRYLLPAYPAAIVLGGLGVVWLWDFGVHLRQRSPRVSLTLRGLATAMVVLTAFWALAFVHGIYGSPNTRVAASEWMAQNLEPGAVLSTQIWDDSLPLPIPAAQGFSPVHVELDPFLPDNAVDAETGRSKVDDLIDGLDRVGYIVEASNRLYDSIPRVSAKYPATTAYYRALFDGSLGFERLAEFRSEPSLFGIGIDDSGAEETFTVYDHPTVTIWVKTDRWSRALATSILNPARAATAIDLVPSEAATNALMLDHDAAAALEEGPTFSETFRRDGPTSTLPWLWWLLWIEAAAFAVLPWSTRLFKHLPDAGYGISKVVGFLAVGLGTWLTVSLGITDFGAGVSIAWLGAMVLIGVLVWSSDGERLNQVQADQGSSWVTSELVFLGVFAGAVYLRMRNPDLWEAYFGGEKPMELADLTAIGRSDTLPPYDPWFAGGFLNYYYFGWFLVAVPMRALRMLPEVAFQLGLATYASLTAVTAFSTVHNLVAATRARWGAARSPRIPIRAGLFSVIALLFMGNLDALRQHYHRLSLVNEWQAGGDIPVVHQIVTFAGGTWAWIHGADLTRFDWWAPSRVNSGNIDITEFPYFSFLFGDLHPHLMDMAFVGLVVSVVLAYLLACRAGARGNSFLLAATFGVVTGAVRATNTWDLPAALLLAGGALIAGRFVTSPATPAEAAEGTPIPSATTADRTWGWAVLAGTVGVAVALSSLGGSGGLVVMGIGLCAALATLSLTMGPHGRSRVLAFVGHGATLAAFHFVVFWPFIRNNETFDTGLQRAVDHSPVGDFLSHWGVFFGLAAALFVALVVDNRRRVRVGEAVIHPLPAWLWANEGTRMVVIGIAAAVVAGSGVWIDAAFAISLAGALIGSMLLLRELQRPDADIGRIAALGIVTLGLAITAGPEVITVNPDIERMNTVFKFWLQAWQLLALGGAFAVWQVGKVLSEGLRLKQHPYREPTTELAAIHPARPGPWLFAVAIATLCGLLYPVLATKPRLETRFAQIDPTLDGLAYLGTDPVIVRMDDGPDGPEVTVSIADDVPLIHWMRDNVAGRPTIVEWSGNTYDWNARIAIHTGLPTVLGWDWHQKQQRGIYDGLVDQRRQAVQAFYTIPDPALTSSFLQTYDVRYVVIGTQELRFGSPEALTALRVHPALREVFRSGDEALYEVDHAALWGLPVEPDPDA